jgi:hypothetical protein
MPSRVALTLFLPGLFGPPSATGSTPALPALETWLARSEPQSAAGRGFESILFSLFGAETPADADLPIAAVTRALDLGVIDNGWWLRADPVHLHPERDRLILTDSRQLDIAPDEANRLVAEIMEHYKADGWLLKAARPGRWYLKPPRAPRIVTTPLAEVVGRDIHPYLPRGADGRAWHTILNEMQILLHTSKVNEERERRGKLPVNSLWFWGGGRLPKLKPAAWSGLWSEEPLSLAFARLAQVPSHARQADFEAWRRQASPGEHLLVLDELCQPLEYNDAAGWSAAIAILEQRWIAPLFAAVREGAIERALLLTDGGRQFLLTRKLARRWWRWRRPLSDYA